MPIGNTPNNNIVFNDVSLDDLAEFDDCKKSYVPGYNPNSSEDIDNIINNYHRKKECANIFYILFVLLMLMILMGFGVCGLIGSLWVIITTTNDTYLTLCITSLIVSLLIVIASPLIVLDCIVAISSRNNKTPQVFEV